MKDVLEFIGDCCFALSLFAEYMLFEAWSFAMFIASRMWLFMFIALLPCSVEAGGYCHTVYHDQVVATAYPTTIIEHAEINNFATIGDGVRQYAVTPPAIAASKAYELKNKIGELKDRLAEIENAAQPMPQAAYCPPGYMLVPCQPVAQQPMPQQQMPAPSQAAATPQQSHIDPNGIVEHKCFDCHSGANPKGKFSLDKPLTCAQAMLAVQKVSSDEMPFKRTPLTDTEKAKFIAEISGAAQPAAKSEATEGEY